MVAMSRKKRVVVAMSGGVDSSVAAVLLQKQGFEVIGLTMLLGPGPKDPEVKSFNNLQGIVDAKRVSCILGLRHYVVDMRQMLEEKIIRNFFQQYRLGKTPNPCILCNQFLKFGALLKKAFSLGADYFATGHYARIRQASAGGKIISELLKGRDPFKDQSYFLYRLNQTQLRRSLFPLGELTKDEVRAVARQVGFAVAEKSESQEICFVPKNDYHTFILSRLKRPVQPGPIVDTKGKVLGSHKGIIFYTVGQRQGLGLALGYPAYIIRVDARTNKIVVGNRKQAQASLFFTARTHFILPLSENKVVLEVKIRYNHQQTPAEIRILKKGVAQVRFFKPQFAITPGQSAVFYDKEKVIGGGIIDKVAA